MFYISYPKRKPYKIWAYIFLITSVVLCALGIYFKQYEEKLNILATVLLSIFIIRICRLKSDNNVQD